MKKSLYLIRHSYAEPESGNQDFNRELTMEGISMATALGSYFHSQGYKIKKIISSPATRAKSTAIHFVEEIGVSEQLIAYDEKIYEAAVRELLEVANNLNDEWSSVAIIGHNPAISFFAEYLTGSSIGSMSPAGIVLIRFNDQKWGEIGQASGTFESYYHPKDEL